eukprot:5373101-Amphidinium_carterae.1
MLQVKHRLYQAPTSRIDAANGGPWLGSLTYTIGEREPSNLPVNRALSRALNAAPVTLAPMANKSTIYCTDRTSPYVGGPPAPDARST